jgi:glycosyltransferase involved in cell wall biosynthesis
MTPGLRVLTLIDAFRMGGAETLLAPLAVAARDAGIEMDFVSLSPESMNAAKTISILQEAGVQPRSLHVRRLLDPTAVPQLVREIKRSRCDIVHAHLEMAMTLAVPAAAISRRPAVCTFHHVARPLNGRGGKREWLAVKAASLSEQAIFVSEASRASFEAAYRPTGAPANWSVVHNGIDIANFTPGAVDATVRAELGGADGPLVVLPAAFRDFKGIPVAIEAWREVQSRFPDAVLSLVGGGELEGSLREQVAAAELNGAVVFAGVRTDMPAVYRAADVVLLPSTHGENLPTVLIEASASGRPIAASRIGGIPDIVADGETGMLFEPSSPAALAGVLCDLLADPGLRGRLGAAATLKAQRDFSAAAWMANLLGVYESAMARRA